MSGSSNGLRSVAWDLPSDDEIVAVARDRVRTALVGWGLAELADDAVLGMSELVSNALVHGEPPIRLSLHLQDHALCVRVADHGAAVPCRLNVGDDAERGRGLAIVEAIADLWGVAPGPDEKGKVTWFVLSLLSGNREALRWRKLTGDSSVRYTW